MMNIITHGWVGPDEGLGLWYCEDADQVTIFVSGGGGRTSLSKEHARFLSNNLINFLDKLDG